MENAAIQITGRGNVTCKRMDKRFVFIRIKFVTFFFHLCYLLCEEEGRNTRWANRDEEETYTKDARMTRPECRVQQVHADQQVVQHLHVVAPMNAASKRGQRYTRSIDQQ